MSQYLLSVYMDENIEAPSPEQMEQAFKDVDRLNQKIQDEGAWVFAGGLHPPTTATVVKESGDDIVMTDGPYAEAKEQLGGFWVIDVADLDAALDWARQATVACKGAVEVRPFQDEPES
ncbi:MAG: YciI family protein [Acidimicrobiales bacterium]